MNGTRRVIEFGFAAVPFEKDGNALDLAFDGLGRANPKPGVLFLTTHGLEQMPASERLSIEDRDFDLINEESEGALSELTRGRRYSYILLLPQQEALEKLRRARDKTRKWFVRAFLEVLLLNADEALHLNASRAAILIY